LRRGSSTTTKAVEHWYLGFYKLEKESFSKKRRIRDLAEEAGERTHEGRIILRRDATRKFFTPAQKRVAGRNSIEEKWYAM
jgi:hypothetical protein